MIKPAAHQLDGNKPAGRRHQRFDASLDLHPVLLMKKNPCADEINDEHIHMK